jgi:hypothetical protein
MITLGRLRRKWEDNIKVGLVETEVEYAEWINMAQDRNL